MPRSSSCCRPSAASSPRSSSSSSRPPPSRRCRPAAGAASRPKSVALHRVRNVTRGTVLCERCDVAGNFFTRAFGLIPRARLGEGEALLITNTSNITMFFMRFAIDAVFIDRGGRVVRVAEHLRPWRLSTAARGAKDVLELAAGAAARAGTQAGDELVFEPPR